MLRFLSSVALDGRRIVLHAADAARLGHAGALRDAVADEVHGVEAGHVLLGQEEGGVALALGENGDEHIGARDLLAAGGLHMHDGAMDDALEARGRLRFAILVENEVGKLLVEEIGELGPEPVQIDIAGAHDRRRIAVVDQRQEQVLQRGVFVMALVGIFDGAMERFFQAVRE